MHSGIGRAAPRRAAGLAACLEMVEVTWGSGQWVKMPFGYNKRIENDVRDV